MKKPGKYLEVLYRQLANVRRRSGDMQKLATVEVYWMRKIVVELQRKLRDCMDYSNLSQRQARKYKNLASLYLQTSKEHKAQLDLMRHERDQLLFNIELRKNIDSSVVKGFDL
jgi:hypothetical protein